MWGLFFYTIIMKIDRKHKMNIRTRVGFADGIARDDAIINKITHRILVTGRPEPFIFWRNNP